MTAAAATARLAAARRSPQAVADISPVADRWR